MDPKEFKERASRLREIGKILEALPTEVRGEAFNLLKGYVSPSQHTAAPVGKEAVAVGGADHDDGSDFFSKFNHDKPSDNARLIAAYLFQEYGSEPFTTEEVKGLATSVGITIPNRVDATLRAAAEKSHKLFTGAGRGKFKPTVHGESYLKKTYSVKKGTKVRTEASK